MKKHSKNAIESIQKMLAARFGWQSGFFGFDTREDAGNWDRRDVLIGTVRSRMQLETCKRLNFYYIPAYLLLEEDFPIRYVAIFQTPKVFGNEAGIGWYGRVVRTKMVRRKKIREVPMRENSNPEAFYYRFSIARWVPLETFLQPKEASFVHGFTNLFLLKNVKLVPELLLRSQREYLFYTELTGQVQTALKNGGDAQGFSMGNARVSIRKGLIRLIRDGRIVEQSRLQEFCVCPVSVFRRLYDTSGAEYSSQLRFSRMTEGFPQIENPPI